MSRNDTPILHIIHLHFISITPLRIVVRLLCVTLQEILNVRIRVKLPLKEYSGVFYVVPDLPRGRAKTRTRIAEIVTQILGKHYIFFLGVIK